jgi:hypothetical protein
MSLILKPDIPELSCATQNNDINPTQYTVQPSYMKGSNSNWNSDVLPVNPDRVQKSQGLTYCTHLNSRHQLNYVMGLHSTIGPNNCNG